MMMVNVVQGWVHMQPLDTVYATMDIMFVGLFKDRDIVYLFPEDPKHDDYLC